MNRWQLRRILIYSHDGRHFEIPLVPSSVNIIVGDSNTGKSALLEIINYCTGSKNCDIADHVQKYCPWVAVQWIRDGQYCLLARKMPSPGHKQGPLIFDIKIGNEDRFPTNATSFRENGDGVLRRFEELLGIGKFVLRDTPEENKQPFSITVRHAAPYLFLSDDTIINKKVLLTGGGSEFHAKDFISTLPYFLGILDEDILRKKAMLEEARKERRRITKKIEESSRIVSEGNSRIGPFLHQALELGMLDKETAPVTEQDKIASLQTVAAWHSGKPTWAPTSEIESLRQKEDTLLFELSKLEQERRSVRRTIQDAERFRNIANQQANRLRSIELLRKTNERTECPLCHGPLSQHVEPIDRLENALEALSRDIGEVRTDRPKMDGYLRELSEKIENKQQEYRSIQDSIAALVAQNEQLEND
uniref:AAA domain n=1 Tax=Candidatus Kentrum sp. UNK TaxID=2126344 RepID=A0A451AKU6_9GAMM|nr:MAG: AAA domain [Candidatus Kentron sp. UNK]VFK72137.1 MAG: AAA domain [Candidatus Kentron sp. UNK]